VRIDSLHIDGFGLFDDAHLESLSPRISIFYGPNESGKSTLLAFIRFMLFGFPGKKTQANRYPPHRAGAAHGGTMLVCGANGHYRLERHATLQILLPDGSPGTQADLQDLLGAITRETFNSIFAFSLHELQQLRDAFDQGAVRDALYGPTAGLNHRLLVGGEQYLDESRARLFKPRSKKAAINSTLAMLEQLQEEIRNAENTLAAFDQLQDEIASLERVIQSTQERQRELNAELERLKDLSGWLERARKLQSDIDSLSADQEQLHRGRSQIRLDLPLLHLANHVRDLLKGRDHAVALCKLKPELQQSLETLRRDVAAYLAALGPEWTTDRIETFHTPAGILDEIGSRVAELQKAELQSAEARATERAAAEEQKAALEEEKQAAAAFESTSTPPPPPDPVWFERLVSGRGDYERATHDLRAREGELRAAEEEARRSLSEINSRWTEEDLLRFDTSLPGRQEMERLRGALGDAGKTLERSREQVAQAEAEARKAEERRGQAQERYDAAQRPPCDDPTTLAEWREIHRRLVPRWAAMSRTRSPRWLPPAVALFGAAGGGALCFYLPAVGVLVAAVLLILSAWLWRLERARRTAREGLQAEFTALCLKLGLDCPLDDDSMIEVARTLDAAVEVLRNWQSLNDQLQQATNQEAEARQLVTRSQDALRDAEIALRQRTDDWRRHLEAVGLPTTLSPEGASAIVSRIELCRARWDNVRTLRHRIQAMGRNRQEYLGVLNDLLAARGQPPATHADLSVRLSQFLEAIRKEDELRDRRQNARERWMRASENRRRVEDVLLQASRTHQQAIDRQQQVAGAWREWLDRNSLPPHLLPPAARDFLQAVDRARESLGQIRNVDQQLRDNADHQRSFGGRLNHLLASTGRRSSGDPVADLDNLAAELHSAEKDAQEAAVLEARIGEMDRRVGAIRIELEETEQHIAKLRPSRLDPDLNARRQDLTRRLEELETELQSRQNRLLECRSLCRAMATDERLSQLHEQKQARIEEIRHAARHWAALTLARRMFDEARKRYEEQRQPAVVRRASIHFHRLTGGRYREVRMPLDGSDLHVLADGDVPPKTVGQLSRGTAEQLYLALRFGFIEEFTGHRSPLPIVMDDILVNFDPWRATAAIESLVQLSERFQILYFTCHPETTDKFRNVDHSIPVFQLSDGCLMT